MTALAPRLAVVLPLQDDRGLAHEAVASWTDGQRCGGGEYELLVLFPPALSERADAVRYLLRAQDRMIEHDGNEMALYNRGARLARAPGLFFTEAHCIAEPDSVSRAIAALESGAADAYCGHSTPIARNGLARLDAALFEQDFAQCMQPGHFGKVMMRALIIPRRDFLAAGGLSVPHYRFADWLLAARLHRRGYRIASAPAIRVRHLYAERFGLLDGFIRDFVEGECLLRADPAEAEFSREHFGEPPAWRAGRKFDANAHRLAFRYLRRQLLVNREFGTRARLQAACELARRVPTALFGRRFLTAQHRWSARIGKLGSLCPLLPHALRLRFFRRYWRSTTALWRAYYGLKLAGERAPEAPCDSDLLSEQRDCALNDLHPWEQWQGERFRWSTSFCRMRVPADNRPLVLQLELAGFAGARVLRDTRFWLEGQVLAHATDRRDGRTLLRVAIPPRSQPAWLYWLAPEHGRRGGEIRSLGLPLRGARLDSMEQSGESAAVQTARISRTAGAHA